MKCANKGDIKCHGKSVGRKRRMISIGILGIATALMAIQFKNLKPEYGTYMVVAGCIIIFFYSLSAIWDVVRMIKNIMDNTSISYTYVVTILKITGITYIAEFAADISKDCGYGALSNQIQIFGKVTVLAISVPIFENLISAIGNILS